MIYDKPSIELPVDDMDKECVELCNLLNRIPGVETSESCCGHLKGRYQVWFYCYNLVSLSMLGRTVERNYSDGKWEILVDSCDSEPFALFWLRSKTKFRSERAMAKSVNSLMESIKYWADPKFDTHFGCNSEH